MRGIPIAVMLVSLGVPLGAQQVPHYQVDPSWPKPLPEGWITGQLGGVCVDSHDHVVLRCRDEFREEGPAVPAGGGSLAPPKLLPRPGRGAVPSGLGHADEVALFSHHQL